MILYKCELAGLGIHGQNGIAEFSTLFLAENDSDAIKRASKISGAIAVSHGITIYKCVNGSIAGGVILTRNCGKQEIW